MKYDSVDQKRSRYSGNEQRYIHIHIHTWHSKFELGIGIGIGLGLGLKGGVEAEPLAHMEEG